MRTHGQIELSTPAASAGRRRSILPLRASTLRFLPVFLAVLSGLCLRAADLTNAAAAPFATPSLPDAGPSLLRVLGALALVIGLFLGGAWLYRNGRQIGLRRGRAPRLNILEVRSLGGRQSVFVVGYDQQRFLLGSTPAGINLLSHLPAAAEEEAANGDSAAQPSFAQALVQVLKGQTSAASKPGGSK